MGDIPWENSPRNPVNKVLSNGVSNQQHSTRDSPAQMSPSNGRDSQNQSQQRTVISKITLETYKDRAINPKPSTLHS